MARAEAKSRRMWRLTRPIESDSFDVVLASLNEGFAEMPLPLAKETKFGIQTRLPTPDLTEKTVEMLDTLDFDSVWVGDHLAFHSADSRSVRPTRARLCI